ncbi:MAG: GNAT family N-acetyltransferase [Pseudomonadota bacterium]
MKHDRDSFRLPPTLTPLQQHPQFAAALAGIGRPMDTIKLPRSGRAQIMSREIWPTRRAIRLVSRGPVWDMTPSQAIQWEGLLTLRNAGVQLINNESIPAEIMLAAGYRQIITPATIALLDLRGSYGEWLSAMTAKWRNALRKAEYAGLTLSVEGFHRASHKWILDADLRQQSRKGIRALPPALTQSYAVMNHDATLVVTAMDRDTPVAAMIFLRHGPSATYHVGWTSVAGRAANAHNLCLSTAMGVLADAQVETVDLGVIDTENAAGLARFKLGSGAKPQRLGGTWLLLPWLRPQPLAS